MSTADISVTLRAQIVAMGESLKAVYSVLDALTAQLGVVANMISEPIDPSLNDADSPLPPPCPHSNLVTAMGGQRHCIDCDTDPDAE